MVTPLLAVFPGLLGTVYRVTSPPDPDYNCIAWAAGVTDDWWWPHPESRAFWPPGVTRAPTVAAFEEAFAWLGYTPCEAEGYETGFEKVALYATADGRPTHMARQLPDGRWTSKLGEQVDIEHELHALAGDLYGAVVRILRRACPAPPPAESPEK
jgi:hypothetical protein